MMDVALVPPTLRPPHCARCNQPVKTVIWSEDGTLEAFCHEEREVVLLEPGQEWPASMFAAREAKEDCGA